MFSIQINQLLRTRKVFPRKKYQSLILDRKYQTILLIYKHIQPMILLGISRKKYHRSIIKYYRSIIEDNTIQEKRLLKR